MAVLVFLSGLAATLYYWHNLRSSVSADMEVAQARQVRTLGSVTAGRIQLYENFLRGSAGLFTIHSGTTQEDWDRYHQPYEIRQKYPDIESIGVNRYLRPADVPAYLERRAAQGLTDFKIFPEGTREVYAPVTFNAQYTSTASTSFGFDAYTDPVHRKAMDRAVETGGPAMSGAVHLPGETKGEPTAFYLYMPVFRNGSVTETAAQRQEALAAFVFIAVDMKTLMDEVLRSSQSPYIAVRITDGVTDQRIYESAQFKSIHAEEGSRSQETNARLYGYPWHVVLATSPDIISAREQQLPDQALWRGLLSCLFFAGLVWYLITDRERKYARQKQQEVQTAKDDLLSLASHQLRTPATVVKQYVGMLIQGYGGKLSRKQIGMLKNAYDSNERQLEIINQLLYVARLDAGRITLHREKTDIGKLLRDVAHDQTEAIKQQHHRLVFRLPKRPLTVFVDPHYMRMVLDNLLTNAIKYTPEGGTITLSVAKVRAHVAICVQDTGVGISNELQDNIFEKFTRVENELSTDVNGSGVGLYLTQQIVELHSGTIRVNSTPNEGSAFTVSLPYSGKDSHDQV